MCHSYLYRVRLCSYQTRIIRVQQYQQSGSRAMICKGSVNINTYSSSACKCHEILSCTAGKAVRLAWKFVLNCCVRFAVVLLVGSLSLSALQPRRALGVSRCHGAIRTGEHGERVGEDRTGGKQRLISYPGYCTCWYMRVPGRYLYINHSSEHATYIRSTSICRTDIDHSMLYEYY